MKPSASRKIHQITAHPMELYFAVILFLELSYYFFDFNPIAYFVIWILLSGITGWRIMNVPKFNYLSDTAEQQSHYKVAAGVVLSVLIMGIVFYFDIECLFHYAFNLLGFSLIYILRNYLYL